MSVPPSRARAAGREPRVVAVALCDCVEDGAALCRRVGELAAVVPDLCREPARGVAVATSAGASGLVVAAGGEGPSRVALQRCARRAGLDPFAVAVVRLRDRATAAVRLAAAVAGRRAFVGSAPEQLRPRLLDADAPVSRRALLSLPPLVYEPVASVDRARCAGASRCGLCLRACPVGVLGVEDGAVVVDRGRCNGCGACVSACPTGAVGLPCASLAQYEAELTVLLEAETPEIRFRCSRAAPADDGDGLDVEVPCAAMVTPGWLLQARAHGARAATVAGCASCTAPRDVAGYVAAVLAAAAGAPTPAGGDALCLREPAATARAVIRLAPRSPVAHPDSPLALVHVDADACTACGACAAACPTGALRLEHGVDETALSFDPAICVGCARCEPACPEAAAGTLRVERTTDVAALARGRARVKTDATGRCRECGGPIAPRAMLDRIRSILADDGAGEPFFRILDGLCTDCRGTTLGIRLATAAAATAAKGEQ